MKDFKLSGAEEVVRKRTNKKLADDTVERVRSTKRVTAKDYMTLAQPKKKKDRLGEVEVEVAKMKRENMLGVPSAFYELDKQEQGMLMFYLSSDFVHPLTRRHTHMNVVQSYVAAYLDDDEVFGIWEKVGDKETGFYAGKVKNYKKYNALQIAAAERFNAKPMMKEAWEQMMQMSFGMNPEDLLKSAIMSDALYGNDYRDKNANRKMAIDILGLNKDTDIGGVNVFLDGGGKELVDVVAALTKDKTLVTQDDLEYVEEED